MPQDRHDEALKRGLIRYCPVCDGFEVTDKRAAIIGHGRKAFKEALFLRSYSRNITLLSPSDEHQLEPGEEAQLQELGIAVQLGPFDIEIERDGIVTRTSTGTYPFNSIYPALGSDIRSELASGVGAAVWERDAFASTVISARRCEVCMPLATWLLVWIRSVMLCDRVVSQQRQSGMISASVQFFYAKAKGVLTGTTCLDLSVRLTA